MHRQHEDVLPYSKLPHLDSVKTHTGGHLRLPLPIARAYSAQRTPPF